MTEASTIGFDIAKQVFQVHGADASGHVLFRKKIVRAKVMAFFLSQPRCVVAMEACGGAHYWGREIGKLGHTVRLIPPAYVKPFVKRQKNDAADAEAICEAAQRPSMRFVAVKDEARQASGVVFRARDVLVRQQTQCINALRGHLTEYGYVVSKGPAHVAMLIDQIEDPNSQLPESARAVLQVLVATLKSLAANIAVLDVEIKRRSKEDAVARRLMTIPGIGPVTATAILALAPAAETFRSGRDFAAWLGLTPLQKSTGGKQRLGATSKMGERTIRRLLILGGCAVVRHASGVMARPDACAQATDAGDGCIGQQDRPDRLGAVDQGRGVSSSGRGRVGARDRGVVEGVGTVRRRVWRKGRETGSESQSATTCLEHAALIWT